MPRIPHHVRRVQLSRLPVQREPAIDYWFAPPPSLEAKELRKRAELRHVEAPLLCTFRLRLPNIYQGKCWRQRAWLASLTRAADAMKSAYKFRIGLGVTAGFLFLLWGLVVSDFFDDVIAWTAGSLVVGFVAWASFWLLSRGFWALTKVMRQSSPRRP